MVALVEEDEAKEGDVEEGVESDQEDKEELTLLHEFRYLDRLTSGASAT